MGQLTSNYPPRAAGEAGADALLAAWWRVLEAKPWITAPLFDRAVQLTLADRREYLPAVGEFVAICEYARDVARHEAERAQERRALAAPGPVVVPAADLDERDPYACTPEERERWAREDQWCRGYARTLDPNPPPHANAAELDAWKRNWSVANWPKLTPQQRRAKERRIAGEMGAAFAHLRPGLGDALRAVPRRPTPDAAAPASPSRDDLAHVPDGDGPAAADWLAGLGVAGSNGTRTGGTD